MYYFRYILPAHAIHLAKSQTVSICLKVETCCQVGLDTRRMAFPSDSNDLSFSVEFFCSYLFLLSALFFFTQTIKRES